jgi:hypothetical protein
MPRREAHQEAQDKPRFPGMAPSRGGGRAARPLLSPVEIALLVAFCLCVLLSIVALECSGSCGQRRMGHTGGAPNPLLTVPALADAEPPVTDILIAAQ